MRQFLLLFGIIFSCSLAAQPYGNEWINSNQRYLKIPVYNKGIHQVDYNVLSSALSSIGLSISNIDPRNIQLFHNGNEQVLHIEGESDGSFDATDYILFYGRPNDGTIDTELYVNASDQVNPYYSLFNDTSWYFLTIASVSGQRYSLSPSIKFTGRTSETRVNVESVGHERLAYNAGEKDGAGVASPLYTSGEGYVGSSLSLTTQRSINVIVRNPLASGADANVETVTVSQSNAAGSPNHGLIIEYGPSSGRTQVVDTSYTGYQMIKHNFQMPANSLSGTTTIYYRKKPLSPEPPSDYQAASYVKINYEHAMALNSETLLEFEAEANVDTSYYSFSGAAGTYNSLVFDLDGGTIHPLVQSGSTVEFLLNPGNARKIAISNQTIAVTNIQASYSSDRGDGWLRDFSSLNGDSSFVIITHPSLWSSAQQYANYKTSKGYQTLLLDVNDLYEQFSYGIPKHPIAIRNFMAYLNSISNAPAKYLFIIGKSVKETETRKSAANQQISLVPTIGSPPADNIFTAPNDNVTFVPEQATGRLAANNNQQVLDYLNKVQDLDLENQTNSPAIEDKLWNKIGIHFAGGSDEAQQQIFLNYLSGYEASWQDVQRGGSIETFKRFNSGAVEDIQFDSVKYFIDNGVSLLSFFGHGSGGQLGINIGVPSDYSNTGKYPIFIANSCNVGDFHLPNNSSLTVNEQWILEPQGGAIGFIASTSTGFAGPLNIWSSEFYGNLCNSDYEGSIGEAMTRTISIVQGITNSIDKTCMEMNLHGDPSLELYPRKKADFAIRTQDLSLPNFISVDQRTLNLSYTVFNIGRGIDTLVPIQITRTFPSGQDTIYHDTIAGVGFSTTGHLSIGISNQESVGENKFVVSIDPDQTIDELYPSINNTSGSKTVNVTSDDLIPVFPDDFSIQSDKTVTLGASTANASAPLANYRFEIDRSNSFNSPDKKSTTISGTGGVIQWTPNLGTVNDSDVFYWRCSPEDNSGQYKWRGYSYQYIPGQEGWSQYEFEQYANNRFEGIFYNEPDKTLDFITTKTNISSYNQGNPSTNAEYSYIRWSINGSQVGRIGICRGARSMLISVIDPVSLEAWVTRYEEGGTIYNPNHNFGNYNDYAAHNCSGGTEYHDSKFQFLINDSIQMDSMISMIMNSVPDSFYVMAVSGANAEFQNTNYWKNRHYQLFEDLGADSIRFIPSDHPYIFFGQKGNKDKAIEVIGGHPKANINLSVFIDALQSGGNMTSLEIPPSNNYKSLHWAYTPNNPEDSIELVLFGEKNEVRTALLSIRDNTLDVPNLGAVIPELDSYENLELQAIFKDETLSNAPQLNHWFMTFEEPLELAVNPAGHEVFHNDTLTQGEELKFELSVINLSSTNADSISTRYYILNSNNDILQTHLQVSNPIGGRDSSILKFNLSTSDLGGLYSLLIDVNPEDTNWQEESQHFNNTKSYVFYVEADKTNPILDVVFDGRHILDGDIVSSKPSIKATLLDENIFLPLEDTNSFEVHLTYPNSLKKQLYFNQSNTEYSMEFEGANGTQNKASVYLDLDLVQDGEYQLDIEARDASNNRSGKFKYSTRFEVVNKSTITEIVNYPNPFSTSTRFVFTLTGYQVPDYFRIQILTANGKVVREIDRDELGTISIGKNITDYAWDGRDQFGDQLANGVYFYRVITKINDEEIEHRSSNADQYFKKGFGKMYLLR